MSDQLLDTTAPVAEPTPVRWSFATRLAFRFVFCYFMIFALCCGNATIWDALLPVISGYVDNWLSWPFTHGGQWIAQHWFHVQGAGATLHQTGSGDTAIAWIGIGIMFTLALLATLLWTAFSEVPRTRSNAYPVLFAWFRFIIRLTLGVSMFVYGMSKLFPLQMMPPSLAVLNEPFGNISPMTLLWTMIGLHPGYEMICGSAEVVAGLLILCRRTALLGALFTAFVVSNVVLYNFFFDVPVKIYAAHLLLMSLVIVAPDLRTLYRFFWLHLPAAPGGPWIPPGDRRWFRRTIAIVEGWVLLVVGVGLPVALGISYLQQYKSLKHPSPLTGEWHVDSALLNGQPKPYLTGDGLPMTDLFLEPSGRTMVRDSSTVLWRGGFHVDDKKNTVNFSTVGSSDHTTYAIAQPDPTHLVLTPTGNDAKTVGTLTLTRVPLPTHYPLLDRGFHLVNEWGLER